MKSPILLSLILSFSAACSSTPDENSSDNLSPAGEIPASVAAKPETDSKEPAADANGAAALIQETGQAESAPAETVSAGPAASDTASKFAEKIVYPTTSLLNVRRGPGKGFGVARVVKFGEGIAVSGEVENTWVKTTDGFWVSSLFTSALQPAQATDPVLESAPAGTAVEATPTTLIEEAEPASAAQDASAPATPSAP